MASNQPTPDDVILHTLKVLAEHDGNQTQAALALKIDRSTVVRYIQRAKARGLIPHSDGMTPFRVSELRNANGELKQTSTAYREPREAFTAPAGMALKALSALVDAEGKTIQQWQKYDQGAIQQASLMEAMRAAFEGMTPAPLVMPPLHSIDDLLTVYPIADAHIGMQAWGIETGEDYDTSIACKRLVSWIGQAISASPSSRRAVIVDVGDLTHANDQTNQTPQSKHGLDVDTRHFRTLDMTIAALSTAIELALAKHELVDVIVLPGNHDKDAYQVILFALYERYRLNPRVTVRKKPGEFWVYQHGHCMIASHHGDKAKPERIVMMLADVHAAIWGASKYRFLFTGHLHHLVSSDIGGCQWEQLRALTAKDAYAVSHAYSARAQLQAITYHKERGEVQRVKVGL